MTDALAHLHSSQIIHRDLKPHNVFLTAEGVLKACRNDTAYSTFHSHHSVKCLHSIVSDSSLPDRHYRTSARRHTVKAKLKRTRAIAQQPLPLFLMSAHSTGNPRKSKGLWAIIGGPAVMGEENERGRERDRERQRERDRQRETQREIEREIER